MSVAAQLAQVREIIGDRPVTIAAATKYAAIAQMDEAYQAGLRVFAENRVGDALEKMSHFSVADYPDLQWHLIGHLQSNKVKKTVGRFSLIHSVDSLRLAEEIARHNVHEGLVQEVLLQINVSGEPTKHGLAPSEAAAVVRAMKSLKGISLRGLMTMAPHICDQAQLKGVFCDLKSLRDELEQTCAIALPDLSMGMSNDFMHAMECGATILRLGSTLFRTIHESA